MKPEANNNPDWNSENIRRIRQRSELYGSLNSGFGKQIAKDISVSVVDAFDMAREFLKKFDNGYLGKGD